MPETVSHLMNDKGVCRTIVTSEQYNDIYIACYKRKGKYSPTTPPGFRKVVDLCSSNIAKLREFFLGGFKNKQE